MAKIKQNPNSILFLFEGETEGEFYKRIFDLKLPPRQIRRSFGNLRGVYGLNEKVKGKIQTYLASHDFEACKQIHVYVAFDREGERSTPSMLKLEELRREFVYEGSRISGIYELIATQDLEAWFFHDLAAIYTFLRVPVNQRNMAAFNSIDRQHNRILSHLFNRHKKLYQKGKKVAGFLESLDLEKIYGLVPELQEAFNAMRQL
jgi:hypothetical protein